MAAFITAQELSDFLQRDVTADAGATLAIDGACEAVRTVADQVFLEATETVLLDGSGTDVLVLPQLPVSAVTSVTVGDNDPLVAADDYVQGNGMLFRKGTTWTAGRRNVAVKYRHGYNTASVPADVKMVALNLAGRLLIQAPQNAIRETVGDVSVQYATAGSDLTANELRILRKHSGR